MSLVQKILMACVLSICLLVASIVQAADFKNVVVISIDALHPDALTMQNAPLTMDFLTTGHLTRRGVSTRPPKTLISHAAMMTGKGPQDGGRISNEWADGEPTVEGRTIFHDAQERGYRTGFFYSKPKLGFLDNSGLDETVYSSDYSIEKAVGFLEKQGSAFVFIHVSGLDIVGPQSGWMSTPYLEELSYIDEYLEEVYAYLEETGDYLLIVTSDHAGHEKEHGGFHPDEARVPFGVVSDVCEFPDMNDAEYSVTQLPEFLQRALICRAR